MMDLIRPASLVVNARCPRCHGNLFEKRDSQGEYYACELGCNREFNADLRERRAMVELGRKTEGVRRNNGVLL